MQNNSRSPIPSSPASTPLDLALSYQAMGWPVFPCRAADEETNDYDAETGEVIVLREKTPYTSNGFRGAVKFERTVRELWARHPTAMVGVPTGEATGVFVLDLDIKPGIGDGHEWLAVMEDIHGELPDTARAKTMGGGTHIFFRHVAGVRNRGGLGKCVDIRGDGGYVIAPGSRTIDGRTYDWLEGYGPEHVTDAPQWLLDLLLPKPVNDNGPIYTFSHTPGGNKPYVEAAVQAELTKLANTTQGSRGSQLNASAYALGQFVGAGELSREEAEVGLWSAAQSCGVAKKDGERAVRATIKRGLDAGARVPRAIPAQSESYYPEVDSTTLNSIKNMIARGKAKAAGPVRVDPEPADPDPVGSEPPGAAVQRDEPGSPPDNATAGQDAPQGAPVAATAPEPPADRDRPFTATPFEWIDPKSIPRREFVFGKHYIRKYVSVTVAPGGLGKSSNSIAEALSMVTGKRILRDTTAPPLRVWLFNAEDPRDELQRRIMAACIHYKLAPEDLSGRLFVDTGREQELVIATDDKKTGLKIMVPLVEQIVEQIERHKIDVMIVDPFVSTHRVSENDNGAIDAVAKLWAQIADFTNTAVDVVHHVRKVLDREATVDDSRGAGSLIGAARSARVLNRMTEADATAAGVAPADRYSHFAITEGKQNLTKMDMRQDWRRLVSVGLQNGETISRPQDFVGVVDTFKFPSKEDAAASVPADVLATFKMRLNGIPCRTSDQSDEWAGYVLAEIMGEPIEPSKAMTPEKKKVKRILDAWLAEGHFVVEQVAIKNKKVPILKAASG